MAGEKTGKKQNARSSNSDGGATEKAPAVSADGQTNRGNNSNKGGPLSSQSGLQQTGNNGKSVVGNFQASDLIRTASAPPAMAAPSAGGDKKSSRKKNNRGNKQSSTNGSQNSVQGKAMMNPDTGEFIPPQYMPGTPYYNP